MSRKQSLAKKFANAARFVDATPPREIDGDSTWTHYLANIWDAIHALPRHGASIPDVHYNARMGRFEFQVDMPLRKGLMISKRFDYYQGAALEVLRVDVEAFCLAASKVML